MLGRNKLVPLISNHSVNYILEKLFIVKLTSLFQDRSREEIAKKIKKIKNSLSLDIPYSKIYHLTIAAWCFKIFSK